MASSHTPRVGLSQWHPEDGVKREDFYADNAIIDSYLGRMGNATVLFGSYTGPGNSTKHGEQSVIVDLGGKPDVVMSTAYGPMNVDSMPSTEYQYHMLALDSCTKYLVLTDTGFTASGVMSQASRSPYHYMAVFLPKEDTGI